MPGLFGDSGPSPIHGGLLGMLLGQPDGMSLAASANPQLYQQEMNRKVMEQTYQSLRGPLGDDGARLAALHPELFNKLTEPQKLGPGESLVSPVNPFPGMGGQGGGQQAQPQQPPMGGGMPQPGMGQQPPMPQPNMGQPQQPGQQSAMQPPGGATTFATNGNGLLTPEALSNMVSRRILGDSSVETNFGRSSSGLGAMQKSAYQQALASEMNKQGITPADLAQRDAKYPAFKKSVDKLQVQQATMGQAGMEFQALFPQFMADLQKFGATQYPDANKFMQFIAEHKGDPNVAPLQQRMTTLANVYGRAVSANPASANTDFKQREFAHALNQYWPLAATGRIGDAMSQEIQAARDSVPKEINRMAVENGLGKRPPPDMIAEMQAKVKAGVPKEKIFNRMSEMGFHHEGL